MYFQFSLFAIEVLSNNDFGFMAEGKGFEPSIGL